MLNFEQKLELLQSYPQLQRKDVSLGRVNFHYEDSAYEKKIVAFHIHPNGNGYIYAGLLHNYQTDDKGFVNIRDYSEEQLRTLLDETIKAMSYNHKAVESKEQAEAKSSFKLATTTSEGGTWVDEDGHTLTLKYEDEMWCVYSGLNLDMAFESRSEAGNYLKDEGFKPQTQA